MDLAGVTFYGNTLEKWGIALGAVVLTWAVLRIVVLIARRRLVRIVHRTETPWDDLVVHLLGRTKFLFLFLLSLYLGSLLLALPDRLRSVIRMLAILNLLLQVAIWTNAAIGFWLLRYRKEAASDPGRLTTMTALGFIMRLVLWSVILLLALDNVGVNVTALITGLGIGGIAVALAVQNILGDLFASLSIVLDKPFVIGDFLIIDNFQGTIEHIGLKTTRLRSLTGEQLIFSNSDLVKSRVRNMGRMTERRILFSLGVTYQTARSKLATIPSIIRESIEEQANVRFDRSHFKEYGDSALVFETVYFVLDPTYLAYMDTQHAINLRIHERFEAEGIEFAYPTRTLFVRQEKT